MLRSRRSPRALVAAGLLAALTLAACGPKTVPLPPVPSRSPIVSPTPFASPYPVKPIPKAGSAKESPTESPGRVPNFLVFTGLGTWIDIFERAYRHPAAAVERMAGLGVRTIYLQTSNFTRPAIRFPGRLGQFIDAAHARGLKVVGWYLPGLKNLPGDLHKSMTAIRYASPDGEKMDGFALDIEAAEVGRHKARSLRLIMLSRQIRAAVGPDYPLGAITPMPVRLAGPITYWRDFPYAELAEYHDAILPMNYFTYDVSGEAAAQAYTARGVSLIRQGTGDPDFPIHPIGGISSHMTTAEARGFMEAIRATGVIGWSIYNYSLTPDRLWTVIRG